jgi:hypothetical protein
MHTEPIALRILNRHFIPLISLCENSLSAEAVEAALRLFPDERARMEVLFLPFSSVSAAHILFRVSAAHISRLPSGLDRMICKKC